jgi:hypothetical protein
MPYKTLTQDAQANDVTVTTRNAKDVAGLKLFELLGVESVSKQEATKPSNLDHGGQQSLELDNTLHAVNELADKVGTRTRQC